MAAYAAVTSSFGHREPGLPRPAIRIGGRFFQYLVQRFNHAGIVHSLTPSLVSFTYVKR